MQGLEKEKADIVEQGKEYDIFNYIVLNGYARPKHKLKGRYTGKCMYRSDSIAVFDTGKYKVTELINCYGIDWKAKEI